MAANPELDALRQRVDGYLKGVPRPPPGAAGEARTRPHSQRMTNTTRQLAYAATTALAVLVANLLRVEHMAHDMAHLGYPPCFMTVLGAWKLLGAIAIAAPQLPCVKEWAYAGMIFDLTGAAASRAAANDGAIMVLVPLCIATIVAVSWATRPASRRLPAARVEPMLAKAA